MVARISEVLENFMPGLRLTGKSSGFSYCLATVCADVGLVIFTDLLLLIIIRGSKQSTHIEGMDNIPRIYIYTASLMEVST